MPSRSSSKPRKSPLPADDSPATAAAKTDVEAPKVATAMSAVPPGTDRFKDLFGRGGVSFDRLRTLIAVHEHGSLIKAAGGNDDRASQFSRQIRELEGFFGFLISKRNTRVLELNAVGVEMAQFSLEFMRRLEDFTQRGRGEARTFSIGAGESLLQWVVVPGLSALERPFPHTRFRLRNLQNSGIALGLEDMSLDFGVLRAESMRKSLRGVPLGFVEYCLCVPRVLLHGRDRADLRGLLQHLPLAVHLESAYIQAELEAAVQGKGWQLNIRLRCDTFPNAMAAVRTGCYASLMIRFPGRARQWLPEGVEAIPLDFLNHTHREIWLAWNPRLLDMRPEASALTEPLAAQFKWGL